MFSLTDRKALVTGGSQGLGEGFAVALAAQGADVAIAYLRRTDEDESNAECVRNRVVAIGRQALVLDADVTDATTVDRLVAEVTKAFGHIDVLVNNAGGFPTRPVSVAELTDEDWQRSLDLNLKSVFLCCRAVARVMAPKGNGRIINITASSSAFMGTPTRAHFSAAKAGVVAFTKALARETADTGTTVNAIAPGKFDTPTARVGTELGWWDDAGPASGIPLGRGGSIEEIAAAVVFLASDEAAYITGQTLHVNGGSFMA